MRTPSILILLLLATAPGARAESPGGWASDLDALVAAIRDVHPNPHRATPPPSFEAAVAELKRRLPTLSAHAAALEIQRLLALAADGHTEWAELPTALNATGKSTRSLPDLSIVPPDIVWKLPVGACRRVRFVAGSGAREA